MAQSIIIVGPPGCGKTSNAKALAKAYGLKLWIDEDIDYIPKQDHLILTNTVPHHRSARGIKVIEFAEAIKKVPLTERARTQ